MVQPVLENVSIIPFAIRCATINKDAFRPLFHTFLVTDEGNSNIIRLHDKLYQIPALQKHQRLDIDYIPHIVIASNADSNTVKQLSDQWNSNKFLIEDKINCVEIIRLEKSSISAIKTIKLGLP